MEQHALQIEALLFWKGEPVSRAWLAKSIGISDEEVSVTLTHLSETLKGRGVTLVIKDDEVMLGTDPSTSALIEKLTKEELQKDLGKAGLETLSLVIYHGPIARRDIDYIRGVNSNFILRNLLVRGLVEKVTNPSDQRSFLYKPTFELLSLLGLSKIEEIPEYAAVRAELDAFKQQKEKDETV